MYISVPYARGSLLAGKLQAIAGLLTARCVTFAGDSPLEESGFEPSVPLLRKGLPGVAEGRSRNDWLGSRIKLWSSREMAIGCAPSPRPVHGETEISNLVCSGREPELSLPLARDDTGVRNNLPPAARVQLRYQFPTRPAIVNEAAPEIAMPGSKRSISRR